MPTALRTPRVNNNDDSVRLGRILVRVGDRVRAGDPVAEVVTDKATVVVEADHAGHVLDICAAEDDVIDVGSILLWVGDTADARVVAEAAAPEVPAASRRPTLKAQMLIDAYGIDPDAIVTGGARPSVADVEAYIGARGLTPEIAQRSEAGAAPAERLHRPDVAGTLVPLSPEERGMMRAVEWHRAAAVPAYVELRYDPEPWERAAVTFQESQQLVFNPLLSLMAWKLARIVAGQRTLNSTIVGNQRYVYASVNLGFTVQSDATLFLVVVRGADHLSARAFCDRLMTLQRQAMRGSVDAADLSGATLSFTSMSRWKVSRHVPVLPPFSSVIVAHSAPSRGDATLGATYDHRAATGADVVGLLDALSRPPEAEMLASTPAFGVTRES